MNWYYAIGDQRQGPISDAELDALIAAGTVTPQTLVWREGMSDWQPLKDARPAGGAEQAPAGSIKCTATGRYFPPEEIVYIDGKPYSAAAKSTVLQSVMQGGGLPQGTGERTGPAWERRAELVFFPALWQTMRAALVEPGPTFDNMRREGGIGSPLLYYVILCWPSSVVAVGLQFLMQSSMQSAMHLPNSNLPLALTPAVLAVVAIFMPFLLIIQSFIGSGILHLSLMVCQGAKQPFETTYRTLCYAWASAAPFQMIPGCGSWVTIIWGLVCACIGISRTHEINVGRAVLAVLLPSIVCCVGFAVIFFFVFGAVAASQNLHH